MVSDSCGEDEESDTVNDFLYKMMERRNTDLFAFVLFLSIFLWYTENHIEYFYFLKFVASLIFFQWNALIVQYIYIILF